MIRRAIDQLHPDDLRHRRMLCRVCEREGLSVPQVAYVLATAHHESLMGRWMADRDVGWGGQGPFRPGRPSATNDIRFRGRGYARLEGREAYRWWGDHLGLPLLDRPELAADAGVAAEILVQGMTLGCFTGARLTQFINDSLVDYPAARGVLRPGDHPVRVAGLARRYEAWLDGRHLTDPTEAETRRAQRLLRSIGWSVPVDGEMGSATRSAVLDFQSGYTFAHLTTDGIPGAVTRVALETCASQDGAASEHFRFAEFRLAGVITRSTPTRIRVDRRLVLGLETYRDRLGAPVRLGETLRSSPHRHRRIGRCRMREHLDGRAVHVAEPAFTPDVVRAMGAFDSIGHRDGLVVHLGVDRHPSATAPRIYDLVGP